MGWDDRVEFSTLIGKHLTSVTMNEARDEIDFVCGDGSSYRMLHNQDCCEGVSVEDVIGDLADLQDANVLDAREESSSDTDPPGYDPGEDRYRESFTWTFYIIQTNKGAVTIRWLGESNGYYSEGVDFEQLAAADQPGQQS